ncbi:MAG: PilN domain-containing protein [Actinomycetota bacterium]
MSLTTRTRPMPQVNLLPPETREQQVSRRKVGLVSLVGAALVGLLVLFSLVQGAKVADLDDQLSSAQATNSALQTEASRLQQYETLRQSLSSRLALVQGALAGGLRWSHVMHDLSKALPDGVWLTGVTANMGASGAIPGTVPATTTTAPAATVPATTTATGTTPAAPASGQIVASLTFTGFALDIPSVSDWLQSLETVDGWENAWASSTAQAQGGNTVVYSFNSTVDITSEYLAQNGSTP